MAVAFMRCQRLTKDDLYVKILGLNGNPVRPVQISYNLYDWSAGLGTMIIPGNRLVEEFAVGHYYAPWVVNPAANFGEYEIRFSWQEVLGDPWKQYSMRFQVVAQYSILTNESYNQILTQGYSANGVISASYGRLFIDGNVVYVVLGDDPPQHPFYF